MEYAAREFGIEPVYVPSLQREISPVMDAVAVAKLARIFDGNPARRRRCESSSTPTRRDVISPG